MIRAADLEQFFAMQKSVVQIVLNSFFCNREC